MIAGIDGGGTATRLELRDDRNQVLKRLAFGPFNIAAVGEDGVRAVIRDIACAVPMAQISRLCIGGAGASFAGLHDLLLAELGRYGFAGRLLLCADFDIALRGAMDGPGGVLIAGTGSAAFGRNAAGERIRVGGWGHLIDDEGSGYAIGRDALAAAVRTADGRLHADRLQRAVYAFIGARDAQGVLDYVYYSGRDKSAIAAAARTVLDCAEAGDEISMEILRQSAGELAKLAGALAARLGGERPRIALLGGLLANDTRYGAIVRELLAPVCDTPEPLHDALWGAAQLAWEMG